MRIGEVSLLNRGGGAYSEIGNFSINGVNGSNKEFIH